MKATTVLMSMATALMGIGKRNKELNAAALKVALKIGPIDFDSDGHCEPMDVAKHLTSNYKVSVANTPETGQITFSFGNCSLRSEDGSLTLDVTGEANYLDKLEQVIGDHLARFAFRENITVSLQRAD